MRSLPLAPVIAPTPARLSNTPPVDANVTLLGLSIEKPDSSVRSPPATKVALFALSTPPASVIAVDDSTSTATASLVPPGSKLTAEIALAALLTVMSLTKKFGWVNCSDAVVTGPSSSTVV